MIHYQEQEASLRISFLPDRAVPTDKSNGDARVKVIRRWTNWELVAFGDHWYELHRLDGSAKNFSTEIIADDETDAMQKVLCLFEAKDR